MLLQLDLRRIINKEKKHQESRVRRRRLKKIKIQKDWVMGLLNELNDWVEDWMEIEKMNMKMKMNMNNLNGDELRTD
jgi:uncharacterized coiled-coil protein SlyX